jgi:hypothetical protein
MKPWALGAAALLTACATPYNPQETEAVRDYIVANQLPEVDEIYLVRSESYSYVSDEYVMMPTSRGDYLVEFARPCRDLRRLDFTSEMVDRRTHGNRIQARYDTIRGCWIQTIYQLSDEQGKEILSLGDAPGDEVFLPEDDNS